MLIRELEQETGLERATIRFYEKEGFITPQRAENGYRSYSREDCETLLKIKLLRQLGMPLEKIKGMQQGSEGFSDALNEQISMLEKQIKDSVRAREVCIEIRDHVISYNSLDAKYYLDELNKRSTDSPQWEPRSVPEFHQACAVHPWKRFFARTIDLALLHCVIYFIVSVVLRIRPLNTPIYTVLGFEIVIHLLWIPIEGLLLHYWGTTPGKWIFGIRIESVNGGTLPISVAMMRSWNILCSGYGLTIPIFTLWRQYRSYREYQENFQLGWDREWDSEVQFDYYYGSLKKALIGVIAAAYAVTIVWTVNDRLRPIHRGADLTVEQIYENYNDLIETLAGEQRGSSAGSGNGVIISIGSKPVGNPTGPDFVTENNIVRKITYSATYEDIMMLNIFNGYMTNMTVSVAMAQDWMSIFCYDDFANQFSQAIRAEDGSFTYNNLEIRWQTDATNCEYSGSMFYAKDSNQPSTVTYTIELFIHPVK